MFVAVAFISRYFLATDSTLFDTVLNNHEQLSFPVTLGVPLHDPTRDIFWLFMYLWCSVTNPFHSLLLRILISVCPLCVIRSSFSLDIVN